MLKQNNILLWYCVGCVKILKWNQFGSTELEINQQGGMWREMRGDRKRKRQGCDLSREKCYTGWSVWARQHRPSSESRVPFHHLHFLFYSLSPLIYFCLSGIDWLWILLAAGRRASLLNRTLYKRTYTHARTHTITFSLLYILHYHLHIHSLREDRAAISSLSLFQNMSSAHKRQGLGLQTLDLNWTHV